MNNRTSTAEDRLAKLGIHLPDAPTPFGAYVPAVQTGNLLFLSGMLATSGHRATLAGLDHPSIVKVFQVGESVAGPYFVMELVDGLSLAALIEQTSVSPSTALALMIPVAEGVQHLHERGICPGGAGKTVRLADVKASDYDAVFYPGGHGPMWDLTEDPHSVALIEAFYNAGKPVAAVCHAPGVLHRVKFQGQPLVRGKRVTGFTNGEEAAVHLTKVVPFLVEDELKRLGGLYGDWGEFRHHRRKACHRPEPSLVQSGGRGAA
jgi:hypothetical protein